MRTLLTSIVLMGFAGSLHATSFFDKLKDAIEDTALKTAEEVAIETATELVRGMIIGYTTVQTTSEEAVGDDYERENGSLPESMTLSSYRTEILPGAAVSPGTKVTVKSYIEVIPGRNGKAAEIDEKLTIWDNEDNSVALKSMTKRAGEGGGGFEGEFSFTLPEGLPEGMYPVSTSLLMDGEWVRDEKHELQLVQVIQPRSTPEFRTTAGAGFTSMADTNQTTMAP